MVEFQGENGTVAIITTITVSTEKPCLDLPFRTLTWVVV